MIEVRGAAAPLEFLRHRPYAPAAEPVRLTRVTATGCPGEMVSLSVAVSAREAIPAVVIDVSELRGVGNQEIPAAAIDAYVVHEWQQAGIGVYQSGALRVPELLLKDGDADLRDGYADRCEHWRHFRRRGPFYRAPDLRLAGEVCTALAAERSTQLWISVRIPHAASPGRYGGRLRVAARGRLPPEELPVEVEVLPLALAEPSRDVFLWYRGTLDCRWPRHHVTESVMRAQLEDMVAHGVRTVSLGEADPRLLQRAVDLAHGAGFRGRVVIGDPFPPRLDAVDFRGLRPCVYVSDKLDLRGAEAVEMHVTHSRNARRYGFETMCTLAQVQFSRRLMDASDIGHAPDILLCYLPRNLEFFTLLSNSPEIRQQPTYYYWHAHMEKPLLHRVLAGVYCWKSGADGIAPYCYQHLPEPPSSPYDDFAEWDSAERTFSGGHSLKHHLATYPARRGSVPTLQWKGLSAGVFDLRYLETLAELQRQAVARGGAAAATAREVDDAVGTAITRISMHGVNVLSPEDARPYPDVDAEDLERFRELVSRGAVEIQRLV